jgi:hypothetical protein
MGRGGQVVLVVQTVPAMFEGGFMTQFFVYDWMFIPALSYIWMEWFSRATSIGWDYEQFF